MVSWFLAFMCIAHGHPYVWEHLYGCVWIPHSSVVSLGMPLGRVCSPLLLHRTTLSEHVQTSGQRDAGRQPLSSTPMRGEKDERGCSEVEQWPISKMDIVQNGKQSIRDWKGKREWDKIRDRHGKGRTEREEVNRGNDWTASEAHGQFHSTPHSALLNCSLLSASNDHWPLKPAKQVCFNIWLRTRRHVTVILQDWRDCWETLSRCVATTTTNVISQQCRRAKQHF